MSSILEPHLRWRIQTPEKSFVLHLEGATIRFGQDASHRVHDNVNRAADRHVDGGEPMRIGERAIILQERKKMNLSTVNAAVCSVATIPRHHHIVVVFVIALASKEE